jgi:hypothetical protein
MDVHDVERHRRKQASELEEGLPKQPGPIPLFEQPGKDRKPRVNDVEAADCLLKRDRPEGRKIPSHLHRRHDPKIAFSRHPFQAILDEEPVERSHAIGE